MVQHGLEALWTAQVISLTRKVQDAVLEGGIWQLGIWSSVLDDCRSLWTDMGLSDDSYSLFVGGEAWFFEFVPRPPR